MRGLVLLLACSSNPVDISGRPMDLSVSFDLSGGFDLSMPDLFTCGSRSDTGVESKSVINVITAPQDRQQFGLDLNGDGKVDNQWGNIEGALLANMVDGQPALTAAIQAGTDLELIDLTATAFTDDPCVTASIQVAQQHPSPDFSGSGSFTPDTSFAKSSFPGSIHSAHFASSGPAALPVQLPFAGVLVQANLVGAQLQFQLSSSGTPISGQINGAIKATDLQATFLPNAAGRLNTVVVQNPTSVQSKQLLQIFDIGCASGAGVKGDGMISLCEVSDNSIIKNILNPDVQLFDSNGNFQPNPANTNKDSLSVGLGFTAVGASF